MAGPAVNLFMVYQMLKRLVLPFEEWDAFKLGIIDKDGNILRKSKTFKTMEERNALRMFDIMILKLKRLIGKAPGGKSKLASYAAALWLIKENRNLTDDEISSIDVEIEFNKYLQENEQYIIENFLSEESAAPTNSVGAGNIAGTSPGEEPPKKKKKNRVDKILKRKKDNM